MFIIFLSLRYSHLPWMLRRQSTRMKSSPWSSWRMMTNCYGSNPNCWTSYCGNNPRCWKNCCGNNPKCWTSCCLKSIP